MTRKHSERGQLKALNLRVRPATSRSMSPKKIKPFEPLLTYDLNFGWRKAALSVGSLHIQWNGKGGPVTRCTATIVTDPKYAPTTLLTAQHCFAPRGKLKEATSIKFLWGYLHAGMKPLVLDATHLPDQSKLTGGF